MDSARNVRWDIPFKKFCMARVKKDANVQSIRPMSEITR